MRVLFAFISILFVMSCGVEKDLKFTNENDVGTSVPVYLGTTRIPSENGRYESTRSNATHYARYDISIPPNHTAGEIEWPIHGRPNPVTDFAATAKYTFENKESFQASLSKQIRAKPANNGRVYVYVHGFYNTFGDGLYRAAQISNDFPVESIVTHFAWPSNGSPFGYAHDRDQSLTARDSFEEFLRTVKASGASEVVILAHSLGSALAMETLRSIAIEGKNAVPDLIKGVALIAPDLDVDLFVTQAARIGTLPDFFVIFTSQRDHALQLSARISGRESRLGNIKSLEPIEHLNTVVVDISALSSLQVSNHLTAFENTDALEFISAIMETHSLDSITPGGTPSPVHSMAISVNSVTKVVLSGDTENN